MVITPGLELKKPSGKGPEACTYGHAGESLPQSPVFPETGKKELLLLSQGSSPSCCSLCGCWSFPSTAQAAEAHQGAGAVVPVLVLGGKQKQQVAFFHSGHDALRGAGEGVSQQFGLMETETGEGRFIHGHYVWSLQKAGNAERSCI